MPRLVAETNVFPGTLRGTFSASADKLEVIRPEGGATYQPRASDFGSAEDSVARGGNILQPADEHG